MIHAGNLNDFRAGPGTVLAPTTYTVSWVEILNLLRPIGVRHLPTGLNSPRHAPDSHGATQIETRSCISGLVFLRRSAQGPGGARPQDTRLAEWGPRRQLRTSL